MREKFLGMSHLTMNSLGTEPKTSVRFNIYSNTERLATTSNAELVKQNGCQPRSSCSALDENGPYKFMCWNTGSQVTELFGKD